VAVSSLLLFLTFLVSFIPVFSRHLQRQRRYVREWPNVARLDLEAAKRQEEEAEVEAERQRREKRSRRSRDSKKGKKDSGLKRMTKWLAS